MSNYQNHVVLPAISVWDEKQSVIKNVEILLQHGHNNLFLTNCGLPTYVFLNIYKKIKKEFPNDNWIGIQTKFSSPNNINYILTIVDGLCVDNFYEHKLIKKDYKDGVYFGKIREKTKSYKLTAQSIVPFVDSILLPISVSSDMQNLIKVIDTKRGLGDKTLTLLGEVDIDQFSNFLPFTDTFMVENFDLVLLDDMILIARWYDQINKIYHMVNTTGFKDGI